MHPSSFIAGTWTYRSLLNNPDLNTGFDLLEYGRASIVLENPAPGILAGKILGNGWELDIKGSIQHGNPATLWFSGTGTVKGDPWAYDYLCYLVPHIPNGRNQATAFVGSVTRAVAHPDGKGGTSPAGQVGSLYAVLLDPEIKPGE